MGRRWGGGRKVKLRTEEEPVVGYMISREDVGLWMFRSFVQGDGARYVG